MFQHFNFTGRTQFATAGRTLAYLECNASRSSARPSVVVYADGQPLGRLRPGDSVTLDYDAKRWDIAPLDAALTGVVMIGRGRVTLNPGALTLATVTDEASRTWANTQGWAALQRTAAAAKFAVIGFACHDAAYALAVRVANIYQATAGTPMLWMADVAAGVTYTTRQRIASKHLANAATDFDPAVCAAYIFADSSTAGATTPSGPDAVNLTNWTWLGQIGVGGTNPKRITEGTPWIVPAGKVLAVVADVAAVRLAADIEADVIRL